MTNPQNTNYEPLGRRWWEGGRGRRGKAGPGVSSPSQLLGCPHAIPGKETYGDPDSPQENYTPAGSMVPCIRTHPIFSEALLTCPRHPFSPQP